MANDLPNKDLLRVDEVAKYFRVAVSTIYLWIDSGKIPAVRLPGGSIRIFRSIVTSAIQEIE